MCRYRLFRPGCRNCNGRSAAGLIVAFSPGRPRGVRGTERDCRGGASGRETGSVEEGVSVAPWRIRSGRFDDLADSGIGEPGADGTVRPVLPWVIAGSRSPEIPVMPHLSERTYKAAVTGGRRFPPVAESWSVHYTTFLSGRAALPGRDEATVQGIVRERSRYCQRFLRISTLYEICGDLLHSLYFDRPPFFDLEG